MKRSTVEENKSVKKHKGEGDSRGFLHGINAYILQSGIGSPRFKLFRSQLQKYGGMVNDCITDTTNYVIADEALSWDGVCKLLKWDSKKPPPEKLKVVKTMWLSSCLQEKHEVDSALFEIRPEFETKGRGPNSESDVTKIEKNVSESTGTRVLEDRTIVKSDSITDVVIVKRNDNLNNSTSNNFKESTEKKVLQVPGKWVCAYPSTEQQVNLNQHITEKLQALAETYKNTKDHWRALTYQKAVTALKNYPTAITTKEEAKSIPGVGESLADKIWEIIVSGELRKLEEFSADEELKSIGLFTQIWGAGPTTAEAWVKQGFRTLDDLKQGAKLTRHQQIGLKYFHDLLEKMPREEAKEIIEMVIAAALSLDPALEVIGCGSYRRLKSSCGDVDVLITHPDGTSHTNILTPLIALLHESRFLTDDLVGSAEMGAESKYMGVCKLPGEDKKHRRLDIFIVPRPEFACALLAYTGSGHFNRSMRLLARRKGMALSHHSLNTGVIRKGDEKLHPGQPLSTPTEQSIFEHLGLEYRPPEERDH